MDRFIENVDDDTLNAFTVLKSNMDRFIVCTWNVFYIALYVLKSNMDRFIVFSDTQKEGHKII